MAQGMWIETTREFGSASRRPTFGSSGVAEANLDEAVEVMLSEVFGKEPKPIWRHLLQDDTDALHSVAATGMPLAIVSNNDGSAEQQMMDFRVCQVGRERRPKG